MGARVRSDTSTWLLPATTLLFMQLVVAALGCSGFLFLIAQSGLRNSSQENAAFVECIQRIGDFFACSAPAARRNLLWQAASFGVLLGAAMFAYQVTPYVLARRRRLLPLRPSDLPDVWNEIGALCDVAGVPRRIRFHWTPLDGTVNALAFGTGRRPSVALSGGLVALYYRDREMFTAVLLHELAHWSDGDVPKTYAAMSLWYAFGVVAVLPAIVFGLRGNNTSDIINTIVRIAGIVIVVYASRNTIVRGRELQADLRAARWQQSTAALTRLLRLERPARSLSPLRLHPDPKEREAVLHQPDLTLTHSRWDGFFVGAVAAVGFSTTAMIMADVIVLWHAQLRPLTALLSNLPWYFASAMVTPAIGCVICAVVWRRALVQDNIRTGLLYSGVHAGLVAIGVVLGQQLALDSWLSWYQDNLWGFGTIVAVNLGIGLLLVSALAPILCGQYVSASALCRLGVNRRQFGTAFTATLLVSIPMLIMVFAELFSVRLHIDGPPLAVGSLPELGTTVARIFRTAASTFGGTTPASLVACFVTAAALVPLATLFVARSSVAHQSRG